MSVAAADLNLGAIRAVLIAPFRPRGWLATCYLAILATLQPVLGALILLLLVLAVLLSISVLVPVLCLPVMVWLTRVATVAARSRILALLGIRLDPVTPAQSAGHSRAHRVLDTLRRPDYWQQFAYHLVSVLTGPLFFGVSLALWCGSIYLLGGAVVTLPGVVQEPGRFVLFAVSGVGTLLLAPWASQWFAAADLALARRLIQPPRRDALAARVDTLVASRAGLREAADGERRRIERDLHDGTQQQLTSLAMNLGMARAAVDDQNPDVRDAIVAAHEDAKTALTDLRALVRGLHPAVLDADGLDAALTGIAARCPVPVTLEVEIGEPTTPATDAVAYFVVSECLTNVAKHSGARHAFVTVRTHDGILSVTIRDDGNGGASEDAGSGLRGLRQRVAAVDGSFQASSRTSFGTTIRAELPCGS